MKFWSIGILSVVVFTVVGCNDDPQQTVPAARGERGETCQARNDCRTGLVCVMGVCSQNDFDVDVSAKQCIRVQCEEDEDCCGDKPLEAPARCSARETVCNTPWLPECSTDFCSSDTECSGGTCIGSCTYSGVSCTANSDCTFNTCSGGLCTFTFAACTTNEDCEVCSFSVGLCDCTNPEYDPLADICFDSECTDVCLERCEDRLCRPDTSCESDAECINPEQSICSGGRCVQCLENADCDEDAGEECVDNICDKPCEVDEECELFFSCEDGDCVRTGCASDRECVLFASGMLERGEVPPDTEPRRFRCLASSDEPDRKICRVPCESDIECLKFEVCAADGFCKFVGCETDADCRAAFNLAEQEATEDRPYITRAECVDDI